MKLVKFKIVFLKEDYDIICRMMIAYYLEKEPEIKITKKLIKENVRLFCEANGEQVINDLRITEDNEIYDEDSPEVIEIYNNLF